MSQLCACMIYSAICAWFLAWWSHPPEAAGSLGIFTQEAHDLLFIAQSDGSTFPTFSSWITRELPGILASSKFVTAMSYGTSCGSIDWAHLSTVATGNGHRVLQKVLLKFGPARSRKKKKTKKKTWRRRTKQRPLWFNGPGLVLSLLAFALAFASRFDTTRLPGASVCRQPRENVSLKSTRRFFKCKSCSWSVRKKIQAFQA